MIRPATTPSASTSKSSSFHSPDEREAGARLRNVTSPSLRSRCGAASFDHLVGDREQLGRHVEAERIGGLEVDHQFEFGGLLDREVGRIGAVENLAGIDADLAIRRRIRRAIGDETADDRIFTPVVDRGNAVACRERNDPLAPTVEEWIVAYDERAGAPLDQGR